MKEEKITTRPAQRAGVTKIWFHESLTDEELLFRKAALCMTLLGCRPAEQRVWAIVALMLNGGTAGNAYRHYKRLTGRTLNAFTQQTFALRRMGLYKDQKLHPLFMKGDVYEIHFDRGGRTEDEHVEPDTHDQGGDVEAQGA